MVFRSFVGIDTLVWTARITFFSALISFPPRISTLMFFPVRLVTVLFVASSPTLLVFKKSLNKPLALLCNDFSARRIFSAEYCAPNNIRNKLYNTPIRIDKRLWIVAGVGIDTGAIDET